MMERPNLDATRPIEQRRRVFGILLWIGLLFISMAIYFTYDYFRQINAAAREKKEETQENMRNAIKTINDDFSKLEAIVGDIAAQFNQTRFSQEEIERMERKVLAENPETLGLVVAYQPYQYHQNRKLFAPYCIRRNDVINQVQIESFYDYTDAKTAGKYWFLDVLPGSRWTEPFYGAASSTLVIAYGKPFYGPGRNPGTAEPIGVIALIYSLVGIKQLTKSLGLQGTGYAFILSQQGVYITHPDETRIKERMKIHDEELVKDNPVVKEALKKAYEGYGGMVETGNATVSPNTWVFFERLGDTGYLMGAVFFKSSVLNHKVFTRRRFMIVSLFLLLGLFLLLVLRLGNLGWSTRSMWITGVVFVILVILEIFFCWFLALKYHYYYRPNTVKVNDSSVLKGFLEAQNELANKRHEGSPVFIKTGVFLQSLEFESANNVKLTGYIWQKFDGQISKPVKEGLEGFILPEAVEESIEPAYRRQVNGVQIVGWYFDVVLRQSFEYFKYPLDHKDVWIRIWPKNFDQNVILIPDLDAYKVTDPGALPGVEQNFVLPGWRLIQSFFSFVPNSYNTNFGIDNYIGQEEFPELYYTVIIEREFLNQFIANLLPFKVIALVLFAMTLLITFSEEKEAKFQSSIGGTLAGCAGLIFSVIIAHNQLRDVIKTDGFLYMEYFYLALYIVISLVVTDAFLVAFKSKLAWVRYRDNLWPKILIWPIILTTLMILTMVTFY